MHSFYSKYFEDYVETQLFTPDGRRNGVKRIYVGDYYRQRLSTACYVLVRVVYALLFCGAAALGFLTARRVTLSSLSLTTTVSTIVAAMAMVFLLVALVLYITASRDMTKGEYWETSLAVKRASLISAIAFGCSALLTGVFAVLQPIEMAREELLNVAGFLGSGLMMLAMNIIERRIPYDKRPSGNKRPDDGLKI